MTAITTLARERARKLEEGVRAYRNAEMAVIARAEAYIADCERSGSTISTEGMRKLLTYLKED